MTKLISQAFFNSSSKLFSREFLERAIVAFKKRHGQMPTMIEYNDVDVSDYRAWINPGATPDTCGLRLHVTSNATRNYLYLKAWQEPNGQP